MKETFYSDEFLRLSITSDFEISLNFCLELAQKLRTRPEYWKHMVINFHGLMQSAMVACMKRDKNLVYRKSDAKKINKAWNDRTERFLNGEEDSFTNEEIEIVSDPYMDNFVSLFKKSECLSEYIECVKDLNELRKGFAHYDGTSWSIHFIEMQKVILNSIPILNAFVMKCNNKSVWSWDEDLSYEKQDKREGMLLKKVAKLDQLVRDAYSI